ncbi:MAG: CRTAC1 family protein [Candidatus Obscuribacterales bacterium]|nr:CRTAC1 family protein [Candidatus Obscuribacterales bacterium]
MPGKTSTVNKPVLAFKKKTAMLVALVMLVALYCLAQLPQISSQESSDLASRFSFKRMLLPEPKNQTYKYVRQVHPDLKRISAWMSAIGAAVTLCDLDGDGLPNDYVLVDPRCDQVIVGPVPGTGERYKLFTLNPKGLSYDPATTAPAGSLAGDFNEDGQTDLLVYYWGRPPIIFSRQKNPLSAESFTATNVTQSETPWYTGAATLSDLDGDGHQDLIFANYLPDGQRILDPKDKGRILLQDTNSRAFNGGRKHVFLWSKDCYQEIADVFDKDVTGGWALAQGCQDLNGDLLPEIYFAHDMGPDRLLLNNSQPGKLKFSLLEGRSSLSTPSSFILGDDSFKGMGADFGDINGDGLYDIYVSNISCPYGLEECHYLWLNNGKIDDTKSGIAPYVQASEDLGLSRGGWGWDCRLADFDNDSTPEAVQAKGFFKGKINRWAEAQSLGGMNSEMLRHPLNWPSFKPGDDLAGHDRNSFFVKDKDGRYYDLAAQLNLDDQALSRGIAIADVDGDGKLDFAMANQWGDSYFFHNQSPTNNSFINLRLLLPLNAVAAEKVEEIADTTKLPPTIAAIGAEATITMPDGKILRAQVDGGSGHSGKRSHEIHFGLGNWPANKTMLVKLRFRNRQGQIQSTSINLLPGRHTLLLGAQ